MSKWVKRAVYYLLLGVLAGVFAFSSLQVYSYWRQSQQNTKFRDSLTQQVVSKPQEDIISVDFDSLQQRHKDVVAWLWCADTPINYPVVQSSDNAYYLNRMLDGNYNPAGTIFLDYRNASDFGEYNSVVYGHSMKNGTMFGSLIEYKKQEYYDAHPVLYLLTPDTTYVVELIAGYVTTNDSVAYTFPMSQAQRQAFVQQSLEKSNFRSTVAVQPQDRIITLSTCSYESDAARYLLIGVLREKVK